MGHLLVLFVPCSVFLVSCVYFCLDDLSVANKFPHWGLIKFSNLIQNLQCLIKYNKSFVMP